MQHRGKWMKRFAAVMSIMLLVLFAASTMAQDPTLSPAETPTLSPTETPLPTETLPPTATPIPPAETETPSPTPQPTTTLLPTDTPTYTYTFTPVLSETSFVTPTLFISETPLATATLTSTPVLPTVAWIPVFNDSFVAPDLTAWNFTGPGWAYAPQPDGSSRLLVFNSSAPAFYPSIVAADVAVEATVDVSAGTAHLYARHSGAFGYEARLTPTGEVILLRAGAIMSATALPDFTASTPHRLRLNVVGSRLWIEMDGAAVLVVDDPAPLPPGRTGLSASFVPLPELVTPMPPQNQVAFAAFTLYQPAEQVTPTAQPSLTPTPYELGTLPPEPTLTLTEAPTAEILPTEPPLVVPGEANPPAPLNVTVIPDGDVTALRATLAAISVEPCPVIEPQIIELAANGTYTLVDAFDGENGLPIITCPVVINGNGATIQRSDDSNTPAFRLFDIERGDLTLNDLTLRNGQAFNDGGSAVSNFLGRLTARNVTFRDNVLDFESGLAIRGAAVAVFAGTIAIEDSAFIDNFNDGVAAFDAANGGAIAIDSSSGPNTILRTRFINNRATNAGGAIFIIFSGGIDIQDSIFSQNSAGQAGGTLFGFATGIDVSNSIISGGNAPRGSAIFAVSAVVENSCVTGNTGISIMPLTPDQDTIFTNGIWWGQPDGPSGAGDGSGDSISPECQCNVRCDHAASRM